MIFSLLSVALYAGAWSAFQYAAPLYQRALHVGAEFYYELEGKSLRFRKMEGETVFRSYMKPPFEAELSPRPIVSNLPFLLTLILATPAVRPRRRVIILAVAVGLLYLSHVAFVVTKVEVSLISAAHPSAGSEGWWKAADNFFEVTGKAFFPILIWLGLCLRYMLGLADRPAAPAAEKVGRNAPCPCGSGKKFKHCCARG